MPTDITDEQIAELKKQALAARDTSYSPYSKFRVGAAILTESGDIFQGANVENVSYGAAICAERTACVKAVTAGHLLLKAVAVATDQDHPVSPCGICRQFLREFSPMTTKVYMYTSDGSKCTTLTYDQILPMSFGPEELAT